jgi:hypothetical protein
VKLSAGQSSSKEFVA